MIAPALDSLEEKQDTNIIYLGYFEATDSTSIQEPEPITAKQFDKYFQYYTPNIDTSGVQITRTPHGLKLNTTSRVVTFVNDDTNYENYAYYKGYIPSLKTYVVDDVSAANEVSSLLLIDSASGYTYNLESTFDNSCDVPLPSPDQRLLLIYATDLYLKSGAYISVWKINDHGRNMYTHFKTRKLTDNLIENIAWIDNHSFAVKLKPLIDDQDTTTQYFKVAL
ncbi:hypothetical protein FLA_2638 [Filimonas lacunae]|nr:hypothetical protein FLA_2638 [Filimonas lacunae]